MSVARRRACRNQAPGTHPIKPRFILLHKVGIYRQVAKFAKVDWLTRKP